MTSSNRNNISKRKWWKPIQCLLLCGGLCAFNVSAIEENIPPIASSQDIQEPSEKQEDPLEIQLRMVIQFHQEQHQTTQLLKELYLILEEDLWLTSLHKHGQQVEIHGIARSDPVVADYLRSFSASRFFHLRDIDDRLQLLRCSDAGYQNARIFELSVMLDAPSQVLDIDDCYQACQFQQRLLQEHDVPIFTEQLQSLLVTAEMSVEEFQPLPPIDQRGYREIPIQVRIAGGYHNFTLFANELSQLKPMTILRDIEMQPSHTNKELQISCRIAILAYVPGFQPPPSPSSQECRDPFHPLFDENNIHPPSPSMEHPLLQVEITQLTVTDIMLNGLGQYARVTLPQGASYTINMGTRIGKHNGQVVAIMEDGIVIRETFSDQFGNVQDVETTLPFHSQDMKRTP